MGTKIESIAKVDLKDKADDIDVDRAWQEAKKWMAKVGAHTSSQPDVKKIRDAMIRQKKAGQFVASFDGRWLTIRATVGSTVVDELTSADVSGGGDQKKWREALGLLRKYSKLVTDADLKTFDDKHPDPEAVAKLKSRMDTLNKEIRMLEIQIKRLQDERTPKADELQRVQKAIRALGG